MNESIRPRRRRIERGIYEEPNGKYTVCVMVAAKPRFRTTSRGVVFTVLTALHNGAKATPVCLPPASAP